MGLFLSTDGARWEHTTGKEGAVSRGQQEEDMCQFLAALCIIALEETVGWNDFGLDERSWTLGGREGRHGELSLFFTALLVDHHSTIGCV